jgi:hypothetical protein
LPPARAELVSLLLQTLTEVLAAVGVPVIFALDNMERLLAPRGPVDMPAAQSFFNGLAHFLDQTRGLLVVLFVERGLWNEFGSAINTFADHRLRQGVRVRDYGCVWDLELKPPTPDQIEQVVQRRMTPLLARVPGAEHLPSCFPFESEEVREIATAGVDVLRTALLRLRDRYDELVLPNDQRAQTPGEPEAAPAAQASDADQAADALRRAWDDAAATGRRRLGMSRRTSLAQELHAGLGRWLELLVGQQVNGWQLSEARSAVTFGDHPAFGSVTLATWRDEGGRTCRVALGPILGEGRSMPKDLEIKLSSLEQRPTLADQLVALVAGRAGNHRSQATAARHAADLGAVGGHAPRLAVLAADDRLCLAARFSRVADPTGRRRDQPRCAPHLYPRTYRLPDRRPSSERRS